MLHHLHINSLCGHCKCSITSISIACVDTANAPSPSYQFPIACVDTAIVGTALARQSLDAYKSERLFHIDYCMHTITHICLLYICCIFIVIAMHSDYKTLITMQLWKLKFRFIHLFMPLWFYTFNTYFVILAYSLKCICCGFTNVFRHLSDNTA